MLFIIDTNSGQVLVVYVRLLHCLSEKVRCFIFLAVSHTIFFIWPYVCVIVYPRAVTIVSITHIIYSSTYTYT